MKKVLFLLLMIVSVTIINVSAATCNPDKV